MSCRSAANCCQPAGADLQLTLGLYDGFDRACGNQWLADRNAEPAKRYQALAKVLADDRRAIFSAAAHAQRAVTYLHGLQPQARTGDTREAA